MGLILPHVLGRHSVGYAELESAAGTFIPPTGAGAFKFLESTVTPKTAREPRRDVMSGRGEYEAITGKGEAAYQVSMHSIPSGVVDTLPDAHPWLRSAMGTHVVNASTSVVYSLTDVQALGSVSFSRVFNQGNQIFGEFVPGCTINQWMVEIGGSAPPKWTFSGESLGYGAAGYGTVNGAVSAQNNFDVQANEGDGFSAGAYIQAGSTTGILISSVSNDTITGPGSYTLADNDVVRPYGPTPVTAGSPISHTLGSLTVDGITWAIKSAKITVTHNLAYVKDEAFAAFTSDAITGYRDITFEVVVRMRRDMVVEMQRRALFAQRAIVLTTGSVAGSRFIYSMPQVEFERDGASTPVDEGEMTIAGRAQDSAEGALDALTVTHN